MAEARRLTKASFQEWVNSRHTKAFLGFLREQRDLLADQWARGQEMSPQQQSKALLLQEFSTLNWRDVEGVYARIDRHRDRAAQADAEPADDDESEAQQPLTARRRPPGVTPTEEQPCRTPAGAFP